jgi:hypothetical protein
MYKKRIPYNTVNSESRCALRLRYADLVVSNEDAIVSLYSVVKQRLSEIPVKCVIVSVFTHSISWTSHPTPFISAHRLSERNV